MRVRVVCDPPLLTEVVELALSRIDGVELARDTSAATQPDRTITLDDTTELPRLVEEVTAWVFQSNSGEFTLCVNGRPGDHVATSGNRVVAKAKPLTEERQTTGNLKQQIRQEETKRQSG